MWKRIILYFFLAVSPLLGQSLFENALEKEMAESLPASRLPFELNGYIRGGVFLGPRQDRSGVETKHVAAETSLKLRVQGGDLGSAFAEFRLSRDFQERGLSVNADVREAYVNIYLSRFDLRIGEQIVVWGRADGINPTNTITPGDMLTFSPDEDDRRKGNFLLRSFWDIFPFRLEMLWIPVYRPSALPFARVELPDGVEVAEGKYPDACMAHSGIALKLHFENSSVDGSLSYFSGYNPMPGLQASLSGEAFCRIIPAAYRTQILGADFATTLGRTGLRGEFALSLPEDKESVWGAIPRSQVEGVLGVDREFGDVSLIVQYIGKHVFDFDNPLPSATGSVDGIQNEIKLWNRMIFSQLGKWTHSLSFRPSCSLLHQTLTVEALGLINFSTEEIFLKPKVVYKPDDNLNLTAGFQLYAGPEDTLFGRIDRNVSAFFLEIKALF